jgi:TPR repeat protein
MATDLPTNPQLRDQYEYWEKQHDKTKKQLDKSLNYMLFAVTLVVTVSNLFDITLFEREELPPPDATPTQVEALDDEREFEWWLRAAQEGNPRAQFMVARSYKNGDGVGRDEDEAFVWFLASAQQGFLAAQITVAGYYETGGPIGRDIEEAIYWHERASEQDSVNSQFRLYQIHRGFEDQPVDRVAAYQWLYIAAEKGHEGARDLMPEVEAALSEAEYEEGQRRALDWLAEN